MPRNGSGVSSVVNTFVIDTVADPDEVNANFTDIADQLTDSLPRDGQAGMNAPLPLQNGTSALPALTFSSDTDTGIYRDGANGVGIAAGGSRVASFQSTTILGDFTRGLLVGLTLSNNTGDATNDIDIAAGAAASDASPYALMTLASTLTKRLDAAWAVGTNQGGLDTGSIADTTYHIWLIQRSDTGVVDALFSTSASSPTMPTNYDRKRRIGSIIRAAGAIRLFSQVGDEFYLATNVQNYSSTSALAATLTTITVPAGLNVTPFLSFRQSQNTAGDIRTSAGSPQNGIGADIPEMVATRAASEYSVSYIASGIVTNVNREIILKVVINSGTLATNVVVAHGWRDTRGRF